MMATQKQSKRPAWAQTHNAKPKRYDRRQRAKIRSLKMAG